MPKAILYDKSGIKVAELNVSGDIGVLIRQDTRLNPPVRIFRFQYNTKIDLAGGSLEALFQEVAAEWITLPGEAS